MRNFLQEKELRDHEIEDFWVCVREAKDENTRRAAAIGNEFKAYREKLLVRFSLQKPDQNDSFFFSRKMILNNKEFLQLLPVNTMKL